jgi:hypothetical protein
VGAGQLKRDLASKESLLKDLHEKLENMSSELSQLRALKFWITELESLRNEVNKIREDISLY